MKITGLTMRSVAPTNLLGRLCVAALLLTNAMEADAQKAAAAQETQIGVVRGLVTAKLTGAPLRHAVVTIQGLDQQQFSNEQGSSIS